VKERKIERRKSERGREREREGRGVQYVHCVMHKCIMGKVGGNEIHVKYIKNT